MRNTRREAVQARDEAVQRIGRTTRWIGTAAVAGALLSAAGFAHLIPHLPRLNEGDSSSSSSNSTNSTNPSTSNSNSSNSNSSSSGGLQPPGNPPAVNSGPSQVTSGGS